MAIQQAREGSGLPPPIARKRFSSFRRPRSTVIDISTLRGLEEPPKRRVRGLVLQQFLFCNVMSSIIGVMGDCDSHSVVQQARVVALVRHGYWSRPIRTCCLFSGQ